MPVQLPVFRPRLLLLASPNICIRLCQLLQGFFPSQLLGALGEGLSLVVPTSPPPFPAQAWRGSCREHWTQCDPTSPGPPIGIGCPLPTLGSAGKGRAGGPSSPVFLGPPGTCCHPVPQGTERQQRGECCCSMSGASGCSWHEDGKGLGGPWWQRGRRSLAAQIKARHALAPIEPYRRKVLWGLDTQKGFGAEQWELLGWEVTVVAALCPVSCLATCFPLGDGTPGWRARHRGRR